MTDECVTTVLRSLKHQGVFVSTEHMYRVLGLSKTRTMRARQLLIDYDNNRTESCLIDPEEELIIVEGPRGSGKSLLFAAAADRINHGSARNRFAFVLDSARITNSLVDFDAGFASFQKSM